MNDIEIKKDLEYLEDLLPFAKALLTTSQRATIQEKEIEAIENLIKRVKELEDEDVKIRAKFILSLQDYIPKSKIKEKLEEVDKYGDCEIGSPPIYKTKKGVEILKEDAELILQELLEE